MSTTPAPDVAGRHLRHAAQPGPVPRVRHLAREAAALMAFSAVTSASLAGCLVLLSSLGR